MAWTEATQVNYRRAHDHRQNDVSDEEWALIAPLIPEQGRMGRRRSTDLRRVFDAIQYMLASGCQWRLIPPCYPPFSTVRTTFTRPIRAGDHVLLTLAPRYEGYHGAIARVAAVGAIDPEIERAMAVAIAAQERTREALRPGATGAEIDGIARDACREADLEQHFAYSGVHSVGVAEFEPPILTSWSRETLRPGMVFSIDIPIFFANWGGLRVEDGFLVTEGGTEPLQDCPKSIRYVAT